MNICARVSPKRGLCAYRERIRTEGVYLLPSESIIAALVGGKRMATGKRGYISRLAFMWRPTVELIFTWFGADSPLPPLFLFFQPPVSEHASTKSRNSRFRPLISLFAPSPSCRDSLLYIGCPPLTKYYYCDKNYNYTILHTNLKFLKF